MTDFPRSASPSKHHFENPSKPAVKVTTKPAAKITPQASTKAPVKADVTTAKPSQNVIQKLVEKLVAALKPISNIVGISKDISKAVEPKPIANVTTGRDTNHYIHR